MSLLNLETVPLPSIVFGMPTEACIGQKEEKLRVRNASRRTALSTITNVLRRNPDRACKGKVNATVQLQKPNEREAQKEGLSQPFDIYVDPSEKNSNEVEIQDSVLNLHAPCGKEVTGDQPMVVSPYECTGNYDPSARTERVLCNKDSDSEYEDDILRYLKNSATRYRPRVGYMEKQPDITYNMRSILVDWLIEVSEEFSLDNRTLYLAVAYVDRFLSIMSVQRGKLQLVGTASLFIAAKFEEVYPPDASEFLYVTDNTYSQDHLLRMEQLILNTLGYNVSIPTFADFLYIFLDVAGCTAEDNKLQNLALYLCELTLLDSGRFLRYLPAEIAASAVLLASHTLGQPICYRPLIVKCGTEVVELMKCVYDLLVAFKDAPSSKHKVVVQKYTEKYSGVARIKPSLQPFESMF